MAEGLWGFGHSCKILQSALGVFALIAFAWAISENRRAVSLRRDRHRARHHLRAGRAVPQGAADHARLRLGQPRRSTPSPRRAAPAPRSCSAISAAAPLPFELKFPGKEFVLAFNALPIVLLMSVLTTLLFYWGILPPIVKGFAFALNRTMGVGGAVGLSTAANIFVGHVEAPLFIRPYLAQAVAERTVRGDDRRHGRHRRHRAGALRAVPPRRRARRRRPSHHRLGAGRPDRGDDRPDHGAGRARHPHQLARDRRAGRRKHHRRHRQGRDRRAWRCCST